MHISSLASPFPILSLASPYFQGFLKLYMNTDKISVLIMVLLSFQDLENVNFWLTFYYQEIYYIFTDLEISLI